MIRLKAFSYFEPSTLPEAIEILSGQGAEAYPLAGGTDLLVRMKRRDITPSTLVNLKRIKGLNQIERETGRGTHLGALVSISAIGDSPVIRLGHPVLTQTAGVLGSPSIRNLGTLGGNIARASPASDMAPSLMVLRARVTTEGPFGKKELDLEDLFSGPGTTTLSAGEIITSFFLPKLAPYSGVVYLKLGRREGMDCALVGVAALLTIGEKDGGAKDAKIALAAVGPVPLRAKKAEEVLLAGSLTEERIWEAASAAAEDSCPLTDMRASSSYRKEMVRVLTFRALMKALHLAQEGKAK
jgi:carbon-monoxide dehydrogenase medium subunit